ncbi:MAG TPA: sigma 54-interacting transcriptional regulator [Candidatus Saccharicenans sp.]|nr:sigma 54-interacting transcriptional regulator [Candidatus Saccharicenans sp.]HPU92988.1 sigma 54-interacting transcriptional regulator [Candidatus Saccharicenans sp.]
MGGTQTLWDNIFGYEELKNKARILAGIPDNILIIGESGVGKRLFAEAIHNQSARKDGPFITIEIPSITVSLFESELFGHKKGSFTDAREDKIGLIEMANTGTAFVDEVADVLPECQVKILRVVEEKKIRRVGENKEREVDVRFIFATNKNLWQCAAEGSFRKDLLYRIGKFTLEIPPLRERKCDFAEIANGLWNKVANNYYQPELNYKDIRSEEDQLTEEEIQMLLSYDFPGNIRQLESVLSRVFINWSNKTFKKNRAEVLRKVIDNERELWNSAKYKETSTDKNQTRCESLLKLMKEQHQDFWQVVYRPYMSHEISKDELKKIVVRGLQESKWSIKNLLPLFHINENDYKKFLNFLQYQGINLRNMKAEKTEL